MEEYEVTWTATYTSVVVPLPGQTLSDAIEDINIPENEQSTYNSCTFEVEEVRGSDGKRVLKSKLDEIVGKE